MNNKDFIEQKNMLLKSIENNTKEHWKNYYEDVPIECIYDDLVIDINEIKRLTEENKQLKEEINKKSKKELKIRDMLYSIENGTLTRERLIQIEEILFEFGDSNEN